jgi:predicted transcriptional regulator
LQQYPRLTFRLNQQLLNKIARLSRSKHRSRGAIIREAVEMYYRAHNSIKRDDTTNPSNLDTEL